ncbi:ABC transporter ATP-binding protein [Rhizobium paknamense]|uniref:ABC transport system ATP-binding protein n=1 Tax=Rhizobium paknamense TaxID=1206817 RepID=A0ABU0ID12_9HYPH|nr:ABC transporter ATP-binding protein [Rhizobium paknamense]MDQ0456115.1 putative ABC transport system ATP-binding protein [Rhizobium paknamense]
MEKNLLRYIWRHTRRQQIWVLSIVLISMVPYFLAFDLPKRIINGPIQGGGFEEPDAKEPFLNFHYDLPFIGWSIDFGGFSLNRMSMLMALSAVFLMLVIVNGLFKFYINTYKGRLGERLLRRIRYELVDRVLRFPPSYVKQVHSSEISTMVKDEVEPFGGFTGDAFVQPAMLGGQALAALFFIFLQSFWLGMIAGVMVGLQVGIIPKMRRRLIDLGRQRQITARHLAGKVGEIVEGIGTIHAYDTSNYERADVAKRLGHIYKIRFDLYQWKFFVKFFNNFLSQLTPFLFYSIGGYFALRGSLDVGQLVAVINAYKDLPGPLKELIDWDQSRQDVQVKYEQVLEQFEPPHMMDPALQAVAIGTVSGQAQVLCTQNVTLLDGSGAKVVENVTLKFERSQTVAMVDNQGTGAESVADAFGRLVWPVSGKILLGEADLLELPESVSGRSISYVSADGYFFHGSLKENIVYGLKHAPMNAVHYTGKDAAQRRWEIREAQLADNCDFDLNADWIDRGSTSVLTGAPDDLRKSVINALDAVQLTQDVIDMAMHSIIDPADYPELTEKVVELRLALRDEMEKAGISNLVVHFDPSRYNTEATVGENLLFGAMRPLAGSVVHAHESDYFFEALQSAGLLGLLYDMGFMIAENLVEIFGGLPPDHPFFQQLDVLTAEDVLNYQQILQRLKGRNRPAPSEAEQRAMIRLSFRYIEPRYRLGVLTAEIRDALVAARDRFHEHLPLELRERIERYDPHRYVSAATLRENIVFGKLVSRNPEAPAKFRKLAVKLSRERGLTERFLGLGLDFDIGSGGRRLTIIQRHKLNLARALVRRSDFYVFNKPLPGLDRRAQEEIVRDVLAFLREQDNYPSVIWVLSNTSLSKMFDRVVVFDRGTVVADGSFETLGNENGIFKALVA